jgi:hypothetical protein
MKLLQLKCTGFCIGTDARTLRGLFGGCQNATGIIFVLPDHLLNPAPINRQKVRHLAANYVDQAQLGQRRSYIMAESTSSSPNKQNL